VGTQHYRSVGMRYLDGRFLWPTEVTLSTHLSLCLRVMSNYAVVDYEGALYLGDYCSQADNISLCVKQISC
jgi:hypothetical protein